LIKVLSCIKELDSPAALRERSIILEVRRWPERLTEERLISGETVGALRTMKAESVDLIFADPPYNLQLRNELFRPDQSMVHGVMDEWDHFDSFGEYDNFTTSWLAECRRIMKKDAVLWVIGTYHNIHRIGKLMQDLGFWILNDIIWIKRNPMPNFRGRRFTNAHETLILSVRSKEARYNFHYKSMKAYNDGLQMRSDWEIPLCGGRERVRNEKGSAHSAQKPEELLRRVILSTTDPGDIVLDIFMGTGTAGVVAKKLGRSYIGIERNEEYMDIARKRIDEVKALDGNLLEYPLEIRKPRISFGTLVSSGMIHEGEFLFSQDRKFRARVLANGTLVAEQGAGTIHSMSAALLGKRAFNGWQFWYVERDHVLCCIDEIRQEFARNCARAEQADGISYK